MKSVIKKAMLERYTISISVILCISATIFALLGFGFQEHTTVSNLFINLAASSIFALITILGIDYLRESKRRLEAIDGEKSAVLDAARMSRMMIWWVAGPLGESQLAYRIDPENMAESEETATDACINKLKALDVKTVLKTLPNRKVGELASNMELMKDQINEYGNYYSEVTPRKVFAKYLNCRRLNATIRRTFEPGPFTDILTKPEREWPSNRYGQEYNRQIRTTLITQLATLMEEYFSAIDDFHEEVVKWQNTTGFHYY